MAKAPALIRVELGNVLPRETEPGLLQSFQIGGVSEHHHTAETGRRRPRLVSYDDVDVVRDLHPLLSSTTLIDIPADKPLELAIIDVLHLWPHHSGEAPSFVTCDDEALRHAIMSAFNLSDPSGPTALYTNAGRDWVSQQVLGSAVAAATNQGKYVALTANSTSPAATDTTLTGEITTASGGLIRAAGTVAHTTGASTTTVTNTFTANGSDSLPVTVAKAGLFNAASSGSLLFETLLAATATLAAVGDALALTWTVTH